MTTLLQHLYQNDKRALVDWVTCNSECEDCRAKRYCDDYTEYSREVPEWEWLMRDLADRGDIDGIFDEVNKRINGDWHLACLDARAKLGNAEEDKKRLEGEMKTLRNNYAQVEGSRDYWKNKLTQVLKSLQDMGCRTGNIHDVPVRVVLPDGTDSMGDADGR